MNIYEKHFQKLAEAKAMVGNRATGQRPGTYDARNKVTGLVVGVRESISDYTSSKLSEILVDIQHSGTVTPCYLETVEWLRTNEGE